MTTITLATARHALEGKLKPPGSLGRLEDWAAQLAVLQQTLLPRVERGRVLVFAADHGVAARGVSAYPSSVTGEMVGAMRMGVATASVMASVLGLDLSVVDVGVGRPTGDITIEDALTPDRFGECWTAGSDSVAALDRPDLLVVGEMGIGNTTIAAAVCAALFGGDAEMWAGLGTGVDAAALERKRTAVDMARARVEGEPPLEILRRVGGAELVAIAGAVTEARARSVPVVLDGFVVSAACAVLEVARPGALDHTLAGHCSAEPGHRLLLDKLGKPPLLDLGMRLGEGSGALAAVPLIKLAAASVTDVATFDEWGISR